MRHSKNPNLRLKGCHEDAKDECLLQQSQHSGKETCLFIHKEGNQGNGKQEGDGTQLDIIREQRGSKTKHKTQRMKKKLQNKTGNVESSDPTRSLNPGASCCEIK